MSLFKKIFGQNQTAPPIISPKPTAADSLVGEFTYLVNYRDQYASILGSNITNHALAELYLFRGWTTQLGYRLYSTKPADSETLLNEVVNSTKSIGQQIFSRKHGFSIEETLGSDYISLVNSRWQAYDITFIGNKIGSDIPTPQIIGRLLKFININDPVVSMMLEASFLSQMMSLKSKAIQIGLMPSC